MPGLLACWCWCSLVAGMTRCHDSHSRAGFGVYYVLAMVHCVLVMRERQRMGPSEVAVPLVPSILRSLKNWAFR